MNSITKSTILAISTKIDQIMLSLYHVFMLSTVDDAWNNFLFYLKEYCYIYRGWVQVTLGVTLSNITPPNNLLLN